MPPKRNTAATTGDGEGEGGAFRWTPELERKLLVLIQGRQLNGAEYERLLSVFPGTNLNGVKIRCSRLRVEQRRLYEEYGWDIESGLVFAKKRGAKALDGEGEKAAKKPRVKKGGKKGGGEEAQGDEVVKEDEVLEEEEGEVVKEEIVDEET
ncbi:hypothetical protein NX059_001877 [Plenodomus lindquistii]|nr:hypothetical protein NX059_001877 [Plenodomus lindquistii]